MLKCEKCAYEKVKSCELCGRSDGAELPFMRFQNHHEIPKCSGGKKTVPLCYRCHRWVTKLQSMLRMAKEYVDEDKYSKVLKREKVRK